MRQVRGNCTHPWIDSELLSLIRKKEKQQKKARVTDKPEEILRYQQLRRETKKLIVQKKKVLKLGDMVVSNPNDREISNKRTS